MAITIEGAPTSGALGRLAAAGLPVVRVVIRTRAGPILTIGMAEELARPNGQMQQWLAAQATPAALPSPTDTPYV